MHDPGPRAEPPAGGEADRAVEPERGAAQPIIAAPAQGLEIQAPVLDTPVFEASHADGALWCCEILSGVSQHRKSFQSLRLPDPELETILHPLCIVISQDCDLAQDFQSRLNGSPSPLTDVLLCVVVAATELKGNVPPGRDIWKRIVQNKDERYQFLRAVAAVQDFANEGLPELGVDFRRCFSVPTEELYEQFNLGATRRCRLLSPFKEHLMNRLGHFIARVGLPRDHHEERPG